MNIVIPSPEFWTAKVLAALDTANYEEFFIAFCKYWIRYAKRNKVDYKRVALNKWNVYTQFREFTIGPAGKGSYNMDLEGDQADKLCHIMLDSGLLNLDLGQSHGRFFLVNWSFFTQVQRQRKREKEAKTRARIKARASAKKKKESKKEKARERSISNVY